MISGFSSATKLLTFGVALFIRRLRFLFAEFLEARIVSKRNEHRIEAEEGGGFQCAAIRQAVVWRAKRDQQRSQLRRRRALRKGVEKSRQTQGLNQKSPTNEKAIHSLLRGSDGGCPSLFRSSDSLTFGQVRCPRNGDYRL